MSTPARFLLRSLTI